MDTTAHFYSSPTGFIPFSGSRRQVGGGIFGSIARAILPKLKDFGASAARRAFSTAANVAGDVMQGSTVRDSAIRRGKQFLKDSVADGVKQIGGRKRRSVLVSSTPPKRMRGGLGRRRQKGRGRGLF